MARYDFRCPKCHNVVELNRPINDESLPLCCKEGCDGTVTMEQVITAPPFHLKGLGWAAEGYSKTGV